VGRGWVGNIKMDMDRIDLAQDTDLWRALVNTVIKCWEVLE
jgi:hypothetical protein